MRLTFKLVFFFLLYQTTASAQGIIKSEIDAFVAKTGAKTTVDKATNSLSYVKFPSGNELKLLGTNPQEKALAFLAQNAGLFGIVPTRDTYQVKQTRKDNYGMDHVTVQQYFNGVPVYDGVLKFHFNTSVNLAALNGNFVPVGKLNTAPSISKEAAAEAAIKHVTGQKLGAMKAPLMAHRSTLYVFQKGLAQGFQGSKHLVYEVEVRNDADVREFLYIDAHTTALVEQFTGMHNIDRKLYETSVTPANLRWKEGDAFPGTLDQWQQSEVQTSEHIYNLMKNAFGYVSYNGADASMITINNNPNINCPNANWNGVTANYCTGTASDDVVAHEWGHAYTEYTSGLIYAWQSGALNEAYSDVWGETVDQLNSYMDAGESNALRTGCASSDRWRVGEKATAFGGAIRDMWDPNCNGDPGKVTDSKYWCSTGDEGGVHINSGVFNHAYALLVDGGTYNGQTITALGLTKAAHIFWYAQANYMTSTTDFAAQADFLEASLQALYGIDLPALSTSAASPGLSGQIITPADLVELQKVLLAVELRAENNCGFQTLLKPVDPLCEGANPTLAIFYESFETGLGAFTTATQTASGTFTPRSWVQSNAPAGRAGKVAFGVDFQGGNCTTSLQNGIIRLQSPVITIPAGTAGNLSMAFDHYVSLEEKWDGGNVKYRINGGAWTLLPANAFTANGYNNVLNTTAAGNDNPMQGQPAFTGADEGSTSGTWGQSQINLSSIGLVAGNTIEFRWEVGTDGCNGIDGWYVDDIRVYSCAVTPAVHFVKGASTASEIEGVTPGAGCTPYVDKIVSVQIDKAPTQPVTVTFTAPAGGTATMGATADYTISPASVTLQGGALVQDVVVRIYNDAYMEGEETIDLSYTISNNGGDGYAASEFQTHKFTIIDDDVAPGNYTEVLLSSGFDVGQGGWQIVNGGNSAHTWAVAAYNNAALDPAGRPFFFANSDATASSTIIMDEIIESPVINTTYKKNMVLTFLQDWYPYVGGFNEQGLVDVWDGTAWRNVLTQTQATPRRGNITTTANVQTINIPDAYANPNMKIRFRYQANWDNWWAVDKVTLTSVHTTDIQTAVNTGNSDEQYLGPNATALFYDPTTGNIMTKIENLSAHDYGCTTVEVSRAGVDATAWFNAYNITQKAFKVTPANNNPAGGYKITLYYKASELPTFRPSVTSMGKSEGAIGAGNTALTSSAVTFVAEPFNGTDYAYSAKFNTGFSGFGLTDAPAAPLPVTLTKFEGKHTPEGNALNWETTAEVNNDHFVVERSQNAKSFVEVGRVNGVGNSAILNTYKYVDAQYGKGLNYYRLKQVDTDGTFAYSRIIAIDAMNLREVNYFPNPVQSMLSIELPDAEMKQVNVRIVNSAGVVVMTKEKVKTDKGVVSQDMNKLPTGIYQVIISNETSSYNFSVVKL